MSLIPVSINILSTDNQIMCFMTVSQMLVHHVIEHHGEGCRDGTVGELAATNLRDGAS